MELVIHGTISQYPLLVPLLNDIIEELPITAVIPGPTEFELTSNTDFLGPLVRELELASEA